jgi:hypothetical protein
MRRSVGLVGAGIWLTALLSGCQPSPSSATVQSTKAPVRTPPTPTPSPAATPKPVLALDKVGAAASPSGYLAFAVVSNPSGETAVEIKVRIDARDATGKVLMQRTGSISRIGAGAREAVEVAFPVGRSLPGGFSGSITQVHWVTGSSPEVAEVASASFVQDARTPSVRVHVVNHRQRAAQIALVAVCWDAAGNIRGGGTRTLMVGPEAQGHDVTIDVALSTVPVGCDAFGVSTG